MMTLEDSNLWESLHHGSKAFYKLIPWMKSTSTSKDWIKLIPNCQADMCEIVHLYSKSAMTETWTEWTDSLSWSFNHPWTRTTSVHMYVRIVSMSEFKRRRHTVKIRDSGTYLSDWNGTVTAEEAIKGPDTLQMMTWRRAQLYPHHGYPKALSV